MSQQTLKYGMTLLTHRGIALNEEEKSRGKKRNYAKNALVVGSAGAALLAASSIIYMPLILLNSFRYWVATYDGYPYVIVLPAFALSIGILVHSFAYLGFYINHRSGMGITAFLYTLVASGLFLLMVLLSIEVSTYGPPDEYRLNFGMAWSAFAILSIALFLIGITLLVDNTRFKEKSVMVSSGIMYMIAGGLIILHVTSMVVPVGWTVLFVASVLFVIGLSGSMRRGEIVPAKEAEPGPELEPSPPQPEAELSFCPYCGRRSFGTTFCPFCGKRVP